MKSKSKKTKALLWFGAVAFIVLALVGFQAYRLNKIRDQRQAIMVEQRQVLIDGWKAQGMTDEEIQQKLQSQRPARGGGDRQPRSGFSIMRLFGGGRPPSGNRN